jgi:hypothetical protein
MSKPITSPWGHVQSARDLTRGAWHVETSSHGGVYLPAELELGMPEIARAAAASMSGPGWYEEDAYMAFPLWIYPDLAEAFGISRGKVREWIEAGVRVFGARNPVYAAVLRAGSDEPIGPGSLVGELPRTHADAPDGCALREVER